MSLRLYATFLFRFIITKIGVVDPHKHLNMSHLFSSYCLMDHIGNHYCHILHLLFCSFSPRPCSVEEVQASPSGNHVKFCFSLLDHSTKRLSYIMSLSLMTSNQILSFSNLSSSPSDTFVDELGTLFGKQCSTCPSGWCHVQIEAPSPWWLNRQWSILILFSTATLLHPWSLLH